MGILYRSNTFNGHPPTSHSTLQVESPSVQKYRAHVGRRHIQLEADYDGD